MILYQDMKTMVCWPDGDAVFFDIVSWILQEDTLASFLFKICLDYVLQTSIDQLKVNCFTLKEGKKLIISHRNY